MRNPLSLLRVLSIATLCGVSAWIAWPQGLDASSRTYTAEYVPDRLADGFDFPVGKNGSASGYYMARKMTPYGHLGDDWNGVGGGNSDYGDPIYAIADGIVVYSENFGSNWGQVIIIRHKYREPGGGVRQVDSLYGHVIHRRVTMGDNVRRGQQIAQIGNNNGMYLAHLHLEIRSNTDIGIQSWNFSKGLSNYHRPDQFIASHRPSKLREAELRLASATPGVSPQSPSAPAAKPEPEPLPAASAPKLVAMAPASTPDQDGPETSRKLGEIGFVRSDRQEKAEAAVHTRPTFVASVEPVSAPVTAVFTRSRKAPRVVDELTTSTKRSRHAENDEEKPERGLFFGGGHPERDRRSRKPSSAVSSAKSAVAKRRAFGKQ